MLDSKATLGQLLLDIERLLLKGRVELGKPRLVGTLWELGLFIEEREDASRSLGFNQINTWLVIFVRNILPADLVAFILEPISLFLIKTLKEVPLVAQS